MSTVVTGFHAIAERLATGILDAKLHLSRSGGRTEELARLARYHRIEIAHESDEQLTRLAGRADHRGAVLEYRSAETRGGSLDGILDALPRENALVLLLDGVTDPHNLGAILRSADQFAVDLVLLPSRRTARDNETVGRTSAGADAYVSLHVVPNLARAMEILKKRGFWVFGADADGAPLARTTFEGRIALVLGSEGRGLARLVRERCDGLVAIPSRGHIDSLNVSVAAGILLYEARRTQWGIDAPDSSRP